MGPGLTRFGKAVSGVMNVVMGVLGGLFLATSLSLCLLFLVRRGVLGLGWMVLLAGLASAALIAASLVRPRRFARYAIPFLILFLEGEHSSGGAGLPAHLGAAILAGALSVALLLVACLSVSSPAFIGGCAALLGYHLASGRLAHDLGP